MPDVANLLIHDDTVTVELTLAEKAEAIHGNPTIPRSAITSVRIVPDGTAEVHGLKLAGSGLTGVIKVGTWSGADGTVFAVCHGRKPAVVLELTGQQRSTAAPYYTEGAVYNETGIPTVICGPGDIDQAHRPNEFVTREQLERGVDFLGRLIQRVCL